MNGFEQIMHPCIFRLQGCFLFLRCKLGNIDCAFRPVQYPVRYCLSGTIVRRFNIRHIVAYTTDACRNHRPHHTISPFAEAVTRIRKLHNRVLRGEFYQHQCIAKIREYPALPLCRKPFLDLVFNRHRKQQRIHAVRHMMFRCVENCASIIWSFHINLIRGKKFPAVFFCYPSLNERYKEVILQYRKCCIEIILQTCHIQFLFTLPI